MFRKEVGAFAPRERRTNYVLRVLALKQRGYFGGERVERTVSLGAEGKWEENYSTGGPQGASRCSKK